MKFMHCLLALACLFLSKEGYAQYSVSVYNLTCEHESNPLGIENPTPRFSWQIQSMERDFQQSAWEILVADSETELLADRGNIWNSGQVNSSESVLNAYGGVLLKAGKKYFWKARVWDKQGQPSPWSPIAYFQMGLLAEKDWHNAQWIAMEKDRKKDLLPTGVHAPLVQQTIGDQKTGMYILPQFRKGFTIDREIKQAVAYVSGLGHFELYLNGKRVGDHFLDPGWTKYDRCALYVPFDVTDLLNQGENVVGVMLGNGFFNIPRERYFKMLTSYGAPKLKMSIQIEYTNGSKQVVVTDASWKVTESPVTYSSIYGGEDYDANKEQTGWMEAGFHDTSWQKALITDFKTQLVSQRATPLKIRDRIPTVRIFQTQKGNWVYDLGQNFSGIFQIKTRSNGKQSIQLYPAELLNPDSSVNQSASGSPFCFTYTPKGPHIEVWQPRFTYYGFRYVQLEGAVPAGKPNPNHLPEIEELTGMHTCNSASEVGTFSCSNDMFNQTYQLIDWSIRSNLASVLTDCPHREKLGWLEVAHLMQYSIQYRYNIARLYEKIMYDMSSTQASNGQIATTAPELVEFAGGFKDTPEWGSAFIICPWYIYQFYGDKRPMEMFYPAMKRYLDYLTTKADNHIIAYGLGDWYDIGPRNPGESQLTSNGVTATAIYYYNTNLMQKMAVLLGKSDDAEAFEKQAKRIKQSFNEKYWNQETQTYDRNSQAANAVALYMGLVYDGNSDQVFKNLVTDIRNRNNALTAGDVGYRYVLRTLESNDASDIIYDMNCKYDVPGYGWQLAHGATALTESWQAYGFVSNNHCMLGHLMEWLFSGLGGIRQTEHSTAFREVLFKPEIVGDIREARATHESPYGKITSEWKDEPNRFTYRIEVPANSIGYVYLPTQDTTRITESGLSLNQAIGVQGVNQKQERTVVEVGSGNYLFQVSKE